MPYPVKTVISCVHVVRFVSPPVRYAFEYNDGLAMSIDACDYMDYYDGEDTLLWWHPSLGDFEFNLFMTYAQTIELRKMNEFLNACYTQGLITLIPLTTQGDEGRYFVHVEDRWEYQRLAKNYFF